MISAEAPVLFAKACEMFILELTLRAWAQTEEAKRRTLQRSDISAAIQKTEVFDFLIDIVPREDPKKEDIVRPVQGMAESQMHYYSMPSNMQYLPQQVASGVSNPATNGDAGAVAATGAMHMYQQAGAQGVYPGAVQYAPGMYQPQPGMMTAGQVQYMRMPPQVQYGVPYSGFTTQEQQNQQNQ